jgi:hypothetical protein
MFIVYFNDFRVWAFVRRACGATSPDAKIGCRRITELDEP